jgi:pimeloyl-ACP methyl ester carboxylesterase
MTILPLLHSAALRVCAAAILVTSLITSVVTRILASVVVGGAFAFALCCVGCGACCVCDEVLNGNINRSNVCLAQEASSDAPASVAGKRSASAVTAGVATPASAANVAGSANPANPANPAKTCAEQLRPYNFPVKRVALSQGVVVSYVDEAPPQLAPSSSPSPSSSPLSSARPKAAPVLVFVHGLASYLPCWNKTIIELRKTHRCVALDLPGYGRSSTVPRENTTLVGMRAYADVIGEFLDSLKLAKVVLVGHSLGGQIVLRTALRHARKVAKLVLISPSGIEQFSPTHNEFIGKFYTTKYTQNKPSATIQSDYERGFFRFPADAQFMVEDRLAMRSASDFEEYCAVVSKCVRASINEPVLAELCNIKQKTLIIFGTEDNLIPNSLMHPEMSTDAVAVKAATSIKGSKLLMLAECGHFAQFDKPDAVNTALREFVKSD